MTPILFHARAQVYYSETSLRLVRGTNTGTVGEGRLQPMHVAQREFYWSMVGISFTAVTFNAI